MHLKNKNFQNKQSNHRRSKMNNRWQIISQIIVGVQQAGAQVNQLIIYNKILKSLVKRVKSLLKNDKIYNSQTKELKNQFRQSTIRKHLVMIEVIKRF